MLNKLLWQPDLPDFRDYPFVGATAIESLPASVDLRDSGLLHVDKRPGGTAILEMFAFLISKDFTEEIFDSRLRYGFGSSTFKGSTIRDETKTVIKKGLNIAQGAITYYRLDGSLNAIKQCLADGYPLVFGCTSYTNTVKKITGEQLPAGASPEAELSIIKSPTIDDDVIGSNAVLAIGYNDQLQALILKSYKDTTSYYYMSYSYIDNGSLCDDFWTLRKTA